MIALIAQSSSGGNPIALLLPLSSAASSTSC